MLSAHEASVGYQDGPLFEDASFTLNDGDRMGVVGPNGAGKSTLLHMMNGDLAPESGTVVGDVVIGYLAQVPEFDEPVKDYVDRMAGGLLSMEAELNDLYPHMGDAKVDARVGELQETFEQKDGWSLQSRISEVFGKLGVPEDAMDKPFGEFSGGQQSRIMLAGQLLQEPDVLLLDEPTNNLDEKALAWLETYLTSYKGAVMVVSHDRAFLDNTVNKIIEIDGSGGKPSIYEGGYTDYRDALARELARKRLAYEAQEKREDRLKASIGKQTSLGQGFQDKGTNDFYRTKGAKVDQKRVALQHRLARLQASEGWMDDKPAEAASMPLKLEGVSKHGRRLVAAEDLQLGYDPNGPAVIEDAEFTISGKDRIAIVGENGAGKSTLLKAIAGEPEVVVQDGRLETYADFNYLSQTATQAAVKASKATTLDWFRRSIDGGIYEDMASSALVWFGFDRDQLRQPVASLSPGEVNKLGLLAMTYSGKELLLLDEPTNHMDFDALDVIEHVLTEFKGTLVTVSHDRQFLGNISCNRMFEVAENQVKTHDL